MPNKPKAFRPQGQQTHQKQREREYDKQRGTASQRGYTSKWDEYCQWFVRQPENVICACGCGRLAATGKSRGHVDHIIPCEPSSDDWWSMENHQVLRAECHAAKTIRFDGGRGQRPDVSPAGKAALQAMRDAATTRTEAIRARMGA